MKGLFQTKEEVVSMLLGLGIVLVVFFLVVNYFQKRRSGLVNVPGVTTENTATPTVELTSVPTITAAGSEMVEGSEYMVVLGDNLWSIAVRYYGSGYNWVDIAKANSLKNPGSISVGQKLSMPKVEKKVKTISTDTYVVVRGDSLSKIALMAYGDSFAWQKIWKANSSLVKNPGLIRIGWKLVIPR